MSGNPVSCVVSRHRIGYAASSENAESVRVAAYKGNDYNERAKNAAAAKQSMAERFRAKPGVDDPGVQERMAAQVALAEARAARAAERELKKQAELARQAAEKARLLAEQATREAEERALEQARKADEVALEAKRKAARDARYAARKARR